jgi:hypothetical protein
MHGGFDGTNANIVLTGKTIFLYYVLVMRLIARLPTVWVDEEDSMVYFHQDGVHLITLAENMQEERPPWFDHNAWKLLDATISFARIPTWVTIYPGFTVQASLPYREHFKWIRKQNVRVPMWFMAPPSLQEILAM